MIKIIFKIIGFLISIACILVTLYFFFGNGGMGIEIFKELFRDGFGNGLKEFFTSIWEGFKAVVGLG